MTENISFKSTEDICSISAPQKRFLWKNIKIIWINKYNPTEKKVEYVWNDTQLHIQRRKLNWTPILYHMQVITDRLKKTLKLSNKIYKI